MESESMMTRLWSRIVRYAWITWLLVLFVANKLIDMFGSYFAIMRREIELFLGAALTTLGLLGFNAGRMCDGNTAEYLSCTRPSAYVYYSGFDIATVIFGVMLLLLWHVRRTGEKIETKNKHS